MVKKLIKKFILCTLLGSLALAGPVFVNNSKPTTVRVVKKDNLKKGPRARVLIEQDLVPSSGEHDKTHSIDEKFKHREILRLSFKAWNISVTPNIPFSQEDFGKLFNTNSLIITIDNKPVGWDSRNNGYFSVFWRRPKEHGQVIMAIDFSYDYKRNKKERIAIGFDFSDAKYFDVDNVSGNLQIVKLATDKKEVVFDYQIYDQNHRKITNEQAIRRNYYVIAKVKGVDDNDSIIPNFRFGKVIPLYNGEKEIPGYLFTIQIDYLRQTYKWHFNIFDEDTNNLKNLSISFTYPEYIVSQHKINLKLALAQGFIEFFGNPYQWENKFYRVGDILIFDFCFYDRYHRIIKTSEIHHHFFKWIIDDKEISPESIPYFSFEWKTSEENKSYLKLTFKNWRWGNKISFSIKWIYPSCYGTHAERIKLFTDYEPIDYVVIPANPKHKTTTAFDRGDIIYVDFYYKNNTPVGANLIGFHNTPFYEIERLARYSNRLVITFLKSWRFNDVPYVSIPFEYHYSPWVPPLYVNLLTNKKRIDINFFEDAEMKKIRIIDYQNPVFNDEQLFFELDATYGNEKVDEKINWQKLDWFVNDEKINLSNNKYFDLEWMFQKGVNNKAKIKIKSEEKEEFSLTARMHEEEDVREFDDSAPIIFSIRTHKYEDNNWLGIFIPTILLFIIGFCLYQSFYTKRKKTTNNKNTI